MFCFPKYYSIAASLGLHPSLVFLGVLSFLLPHWGLYVLHHWTAVTAPNFFLSPLSSTLQPEYYLNTKSDHNCWSLTASQPLNFIWCTWSKCCHGFLTGWTSFWLPPCLEALFSDALLLQEHPNKPAVSFLDIPCSFLFYYMCGFHVTVPFSLV